MELQDMFFNIPSMAYRKKRDRVFIKSITGTQAQLTFVRLEPGEVTDHRHSHEQIGYILSGQVEVTIAGNRRKLGPGDAYVIPGGVSHGFKVLTDEVLEYFEIFSPPKEENRT
jgi:quercetin dioxygenase-like cupin family protein